MEIPQIAAICLLISALLIPSIAIADEEQAIEEVRLRLVSAVDGTKDRDTVRIGLHVRLAPGWKTYWRSPGDAGIPPAFDWSGSRNLDQATVLWPHPEYFESYGIGSWGYSGEVVFPIDVALSEQGAPLDLKLRLHLGLCEKICIPYEQSMALSLPASTSSPSKEAPLIEAFAHRVPLEAGTPGTIIEAVTAQTTEARKFILTVMSGQGLSSPQVIVEGKDGSYFDVISREFASSRKETRFLVEADLPSKTDRLAGQDIMVTVINGEFAAQKQIRIE